MDVKDIITLANAGFTAQQIAALQAPVQPQVQTQAPEPTQPQVQAQTTPQAATLDALTAEVNRLATLVQTQAIIGSNQPPIQSVDDILASIINPPEVSNGSK